MMHEFTRETVRERDHNFKRTCAQPKFFKVIHQRREEIVIFRVPMKDWRCCAVLWLLTVLIASTTRTHNTNSRANKRERERNRREQCRTSYVERARGARGMPWRYVSPKRRKESKHHVAEIRPFCPGTRARERCTMCHLLLKSEFRTCKRWHTHTRVCV